MIVVLLLLVLTSCSRMPKMAKLKPEPFRDLDKIIGELTDTISNGATNPKLYLECGKAYLQKAAMLRRRQADFSWNSYEFVEKGSAVLSKGLELDSASSELLYYHGLSLIELNQYLWPTWSEAISNLEQAASLDPKNGHILVGLAQAIVQFQKAIQLNPYVGSPYSALGSIYFNKGDSAKAREFFRLALLTNDSTVWRDVFDGYVDMGQLEDASQLLETSTKNGFRKSLAYVGIADRYLRKRDTRSAEKYFLKSLAESSRHQWAEEGMGRLYARMSNMEFTSLIGCEIRAKDGFTIGVVTPDTSNPGSFLKTNFRFDSQDTLISRYNSLSDYGGLDGSMSPFNRRSLTPPRIIRRGSFVASLTDNPNITPRISATKLVGFLSELNQEKNSKDSSRQKR